MFVILAVLSLLCDLGELYKIRLLFVILILDFRTEMLFIQDSVLSLTEVGFEPTTVKLLKVKALP